MMADPTNRANLAPVAELARVPLGPARNSREFRYVARDQNLRIMASAAPATDLWSQVRFPWPGSKCAILCGLHTTWFGCFARSSDRYVARPRAGFRSGPSWLECAASDQRPLLLLG